MVIEYLSQFTQVARYANDEHTTKNKRMDKFLDVLAKSLMCQLIVHTFPNFRTLVHKAIILENERHNLEETRKRCMTHPTQVHNNKFRSDPPKYTVPRPSALAPRPHHSNSPNVAKARNSYCHSSVTCFFGGEEGHYIKQCPKEENNIPRTDSNGTISAPHKKGRVNHVTIEESRNAPDVIVNMFPVNTIAATVLFDSGAYHSYVSKRFASKYHFPFFPFG
jgi:hypothetical protein